MGSKSRILLTFLGILLFTVLAATVVCWGWMRDLSARKNAARIEGEMPICNQCEEGEPGRFWFLPESSMGVGRRVAICTKERTEDLFFYFLESQQQGEWILTIGGRLIPGSSSNAPEQHELELHDRDIIPIKSALYHVSPSNEGIRLDAIELAEYRIILDADSFCIPGNLASLCLIPEVVNGVWQRDYVTLEGVDTEPLAAHVKLSPTYEISKPGATGDWRPKTCRLSVGDVWRPRGVSYDVVAIVPPQRLPEGNVVGWVELRLHK